MQTGLKTRIFGGLCVILLGWLPGRVQAQQHAQYTQYMYNTAVINPAYAGSRENAVITALYRSQWIGLDGAPTTQNLNVTAPVGERVGLGVSIINDEIGNGTSQETLLDAMFAYTVPVSHTGRLSFGLMARGNLLNVDSNKLQHYDPTIAPEEAQIDHKFTPNVGVGIYYYTEKAYLGLSAPSLLETEHFNSSGTGESYVLKERLYVNLIAGYVFSLNPRLKFKPAMLIQASQGAPLTANISGNFLFNDRFRIGAAYRWDSAISAMVGFQIGPDFLLGMAYDKETSALGNTHFNDGSFEVFLQYTFGGGGDRKGMIRSPRFF